MGTDALGFEPVLSAESDAFLLVHSYMFSTAGAPITEVVQLNQLAAERENEFAFIGCSGSPMRPLALPLGD